MCLEINGDECETLALKKGYKILITKTAKT